MPTLVHRIWLFALLIGLVAAGAAGLVSAHGGDPTLIHGCVSTSTRCPGRSVPAMAWRVPPAAAARSARPWIGMPRGLPAPLVSRGLKVVRARRDPAVRKGILAHPDPAVRQGIQGRPDPAVPKGI
jgi:hypothetical protein